MNGIDFKKSTPVIILFSFLIILWWRAVWSLLDVVFGRLAKGKKSLLIAFDLASIALVISIVFMDPDVRERFH